MQVTDPKALRKLNVRLSEPRYVDVRSFLEAVRSNPQDVDYSRLVDLFTLKRVRENQQMVAILQEIGQFVDVGDFRCASGVAERVLNPPQVAVLPKPTEKV